jgi:3-O-methylgallate 3,4-dioxygenase
MEGYEFMAKLVLGIGTSHTPMINAKPEEWSYFSERDKSRIDLIETRSYTAVTYPELLATASSDVAKQLNIETYRSWYDRMQQATNALVAKVRQLQPDIVLIVSDDQEEWLFDDNMPTFMIYWGETLKGLPRSGAPGMWAHGTEEREIPVDTALARHLIDHLIDADFDVAHARYTRDAYGGDVGPAANSYLRSRRQTKARPFGTPHGFTYITTRIMENEPIPIVPVFQNTCYPPNQPTARRCFAFGKAISNAIENWNVDKRIAVVASGGLSHFVLDEASDRAVLEAIERKDADHLSNVPRAQLQSASSETLNWITTAGACEKLPFHLLDYVPAVRTEAGTGGGWAFAYWQ